MRPTKTSEKNRVNTANQRSQSSPIYRSDGRALGLVFSDLTVSGVLAGASRAPDILALFQTLVVDWPVGLVRRIMAHRGPATSTRRLIRDTCGVVPAGETLLVLGRPGAGCTTLLKTLANERASFTGVDGCVQYGSILAEEMSKQYKTEVVYNNEDDIHFPTLTVKNTLDFALRLRRPSTNTETDGDFADRMTDEILGALGILHTKHTIVGNAHVRGVSGGERKRVSLAEVLSTGPAVVAWDNPLRGLDSSSALAFCRLIKGLSKATGMVNIVAAYQLSETIYRECFDRVLVLHEGRMIYSGRAGDSAKRYFEDYLGFECHPRQTTPDYLTAVTSPDERRVKPDHLPPPPLSPSGLAEAFQRSAHCESLREEITQFRAEASQSASTEAFRKSVADTKHKFTLKQSNEPRSILTQLGVTVRRHYQLLWGDKKTQALVMFLALANALIVGSAFYKPSKTSTGAFMLSGAVFFTFIYFALNALAETSATLHGRTINRKQHSQLGMLHPGIAAVGQIIADLPVVFVQTIMFSVPYYFLLGLPNTASNFWFFELIVFAFYATVLSLFRMLGAWAPNVPVALLMGGVAMPVVLAYSGYAPPFPTQLRWGSWLRRVSPSPYALEAAMGFEFKDILLSCSAAELVPSGVGYENVSVANQGCPISGSTVGEATVTGSTYLWAHFNYLPSNAWQNFGIILVFLFLYLVLVAVGLTVMSKERKGSGGGHIFKRTAVISADIGNEEALGDGADVETQSVKSSSRQSSSQQTQCDPNSSSTSVEQQVQVREKQTQASAFTFSDISYHVSVNSESRQLLSSISGYVRPGQLTALMGVSGAGKTTLLDVLSQRKTDGVVTGDVIYGGRRVADLGPAFVKACGFCMQQDVHDPGTTVREALLFSAFMRRPTKVSREEKESHVGSVMSLLGLESIADALIGTPGQGGLTVEERKRVTIGVELAADPEAMIYLDEPTSGLDSQAAYSLVLFLQRIAASGVPIICTIHQPSAVIFDMFDHVLLLASGGRTVYFGETGENSSIVVDYFARNGITMDSHANAAEFILDTVTTSSGADTWSRIWSASAENHRLKDTISYINSSAEKDVVNTSTGNGPLPGFAQQFLILTHRHWLSMWRDGFYSCGRLVKVIFMGLFFGFTFFKANNTEQGIQNRMLSLLLIQWIVPASSADLQDIWFAKWTLYASRERSGVGYHPLALCAALVAVEVPLAIVIYTVAYLCFWFGVGLPAAGFGYLLFLALGIFGIGFSFAVASLSPNTTIAGYANSLLWCIMATFGGVALPHASMGDFYGPWMFWANPLRYWLGPLISVALHDQPVQCATGEMTIINPPTGQTCAAYLSNFVATAGGYVANPNAVSECGYCPYNVGDEYLATFDFYYDERWRDWGVFTAFCISTLAIAFAASLVRFGKQKKD
ncbi:hypothetical protein PFICI_03237 [Pestalotiopsis fici W106-1]|uniref:ABC transporter domain-containing protein n=1 Tax=Pestalotiopsis fici (strain W106-1 / CGMCC3.15140) TaxID=1229662 RepID=W3XIE6_PESFW|nr:uncharacterized protein PFICI_03237 [Pestalotiopsis fici W106-1]ETS85212.1 hypothetical protein PFICI_03237 [Pestalotiopsis fici W106-1]